MTLPYCFLNAEVRGAVRVHWERYKTSREVTAESRSPGPGVRSARASVCHLSISSGFAAGSSRTSKRKSAREMRRKSERLAAVASANANLAADSGSATVLSSNSREDVEATTAFSAALAKNLVRGLPFIHCEIQRKLPNSDFLGSVRALGTLRKICCHTGHFPQGKSREAGPKLNLRTAAEVGARAALSLFFHSAPPSRKGENCCYTTYLRM